MAIQQTVQIVAVDKTARVFNSIDSRLKTLGNSTKRLENGFGNLQSRILAIGGTIATVFGVRAILNTASQVEQLGVRFQFLFGSVQEGNKAFQEMLDYASQVPFTLEQIQAGAGSLAVISDNAEELAENMRIVGNVAAVSGLDFRTASEQIQRAFSSGAASAELFRERGILALVGFQQGASYTAEETAKRFEEVFGPGGKFENATLALANTYDGVLSMIQDKIFKFTLALGNQGGLLDFAKGILGTLDKILNEQFGSIEKFAEMAGQKIIEFVQRTVIGIASVMDMIMPVFKLAAEGISGLWNILQSLPAGVRELGLIGFFLLGPKGKLLVLIFGAVFDKIRAGIGYLVEGFGVAQNAIVGLLDAVGLVSEDMSATFAKNMAANAELAERLKTPLAELNKQEKELGENTGAGKLEQAMIEFFKQVKLTQEEQAKLKKQIEGVIGGTGAVVDETVTLNGAAADVVKQIQNQRDRIIGLTTDQKVALELERLKVDKIFEGVDASQQAIDNKKKEIEGLIRENILLDEQIAKRKEIETGLGQISTELGGGAFAKVDPEFERQQQQRNILIEGLNNQQITLEEFYAARDALERKWAEQSKRNEENRLKGIVEKIMTGTAEIPDLEAAIGKDRLKVAGMVGMELLNMAAQHNKEAFEMLKKVNIAMALVETYMATINAFQKGNEVGGPVLGFIYAAVTAAAGAAKIAQLRSVQYSGAREKGGPVGSNQSYLVGERGPELFVPNAGGTIVPNDQMGNGPVTVNFNINVVDSEQFDTLLYKRRGLITGIINDAMTKRGREGVI